MPWIGLENTAFPLANGQSGMDAKAYDDTAASGLKGSPMQQSHVRCCRSPEIPHGQSRHDQSHTLQLAEDLKKSIKPPISPQYDWGLVISDIAYSVSRFHE